MMDAEDKHENVGERILVWLDTQFDANIRLDFERIFSRISTFENAEQCTTFLNQIDNERIFLVVSGRLGEEIVRKIHDRIQIDAIFVFCMDKSKHEQWTNQWKKIHGIFTQTVPLCQALHRAVDQSEEFSSISITFLFHDDTQSNIDQSKISYMYTQILKDILLSNEYRTPDIEEFAQYCRELYKGNEKELKIIKEFQMTYKRKHSIWWYTRDCFLYRMLNDALRWMDLETIMKMDFFIRDLHERITSLHAKEWKQSHRKESFNVYRGQKLSRNHFEQLRQAKSGLLSFNNFLSTSTNREIALKFTPYIRMKSNVIRVFFVMKIDPSLSSIPFAFIQDYSSFKQEDEVLFSMHTIFRIESIKWIDDYHGYWEIELIQVNGSDHELHQLTNCLRTEIQGYTPWDRLGRLFIQMGQMNKAEEVYQRMLKTALDHRAKANLYNQLGWLKDTQGEYQQAIDFYEKSLKITRKHYEDEKDKLASGYNNISVVYSRMNDYTNAFSCCQKALELALKIYNPNHIQLAPIYNNLGLIYLKLNDLSKARAYLQKAFDIRKKSHPSNHPDLAESYQNLGLLFQTTNNRTQASKYYQEANSIRQQILPSNHPNLQVLSDRTSSMLTSVKESL